MEQPNCSDYTALGYKCVKFWECGEDGNIVEDSSNIHGEDLMDVRLGNSRSRHNPGSFNPWDKVCGNYEVCCKGKCKVDQEREVEKQKQKSQ